MVMVDITRSLATKYRADALSFRAVLHLEFPVYTLVALANWVTLRPLPFARIAYAAASASLRAHCSKSHDHVDQLDKLRFRRQIRPALEHLKLNIIDSLHLCLLLGC